MTVGVAWIRAAADSEELWLATDSRLTGDGYVWDDCPKLMPLPRRDAVVGFSGSTEQGYPLMIQIASAIRSYAAAADGTLEFFRMVAHLERVANAMLNRLAVDTAVHGIDPSRREFAGGGDRVLIGGYSRHWGRMAVRALQYGGRNQWNFGRVRTVAAAGATVHVFGDSPSRGRFLYHLGRLLAERAHTEDHKALQLEPLEVIAAMLRMPQGDQPPLLLEQRPRTIGGAPQVVRIVPGADATAFAVRWSDGQTVADYLLGRRVFAYERLDVPLIRFEEDRVHLYARNQWEPARFGDATGNPAS